MEKKRIVWVDLAKFFCMFAVMADHSAMMTDALDGFVEPWYLNLFSFAAGYVYFHRRGFGAFFRKKTRQLFVPWLVFSMLTIALAQVLSFNEHEPFLVEAGKNLLQIQYYGSEMWYVAALFVAFLPFYFFIDAFERSALPERKRQVLFLLAAFLLSAASAYFSNFGPRELFPWGRPEVPVTLPWHLEYMFQAMFYMFLGYLFRRYWEPAFDRKNSWALFALLLALHLVMVYGVRRTGSWYTLRVRLFHMYLCALVAMAMVISLSKQIAGTRHMRYVGQNTVVYYGLHGKAESLLQTLLRRLAPDLWNTLRWSIGGWRVIAALGIAWAVSWLLVPAAWVINRFFPFLLGRRKKA